MKKKLLTVLLSAVMIFGVFGLTACSAENPDNDYNYYGVKYELLKGDGAPSEVKIEAVTYQSVFRMLSTSGKYLLYVDTEDSGAAARFKALNKLANDWHVTIYHFNPDLSGGYAKNSAVGHSSTLLNSAKTGANGWEKDATVNNESNLPLLYDILNNYGANWDAVQDHDLLIINGKDSTWKETNVYTAEDSKKYGVADATSSSCTTGKLKPIFGASISRANYDEKKNTSPKNWGYLLASGAERKPSYGQYFDKDKDVTLDTEARQPVPDAYFTETIYNTFNTFADGRLHMYNEDLNDTATNQFTEEKTDLFVTVANYGQFAHLMDNNNGDFAVFFGGTWCPNTQAIAWLTNKVAKDYGISKIYFFDPRFDDGYQGEVGTLNDDGTITVNKNNSGAHCPQEINTRGGDAKPGNQGTRNSYNYNYIYAEFLNNYLPTYVSAWNVGTKLTITVAAGKTETKTQMCVPCIMMFDGSKADAPAELVGLAEAEYLWAQTSDETNPYHIAWVDAVKGVFDKNRYAHYNPIIEEEATEEAASSSSSSSSSASSDAGAC